MINRILFTSLLLISNICSAQDSLRSAIHNSEAAIKAQRERIKIVSQNLANENSTSIYPGGDPYKRKIIFFKEKYNPKIKQGRVKIMRQGVDNSSFKTIYDPTHPAADEKGFVKYPNVEKNIELRDAMEAERSIEANMSVIETSKRIINNTLDLIR